MEISLPMAQTDDGPADLSWLTGNVILATGSGPNAN